ncbi:hypothetical protein BV25DRAFT_1787751, partial [Artomyces pyxidatus]
LQIGDGENKCTYNLKGMIYHGGDHFTARIVNDKGEVWYHDGISTGRHCRAETRLTGIPDIYTVVDRSISVVVYS